jgi:hypothetical protein
MDARICIVFRRDGTVRTEILEASSLAGAIDASHQLAHHMPGAVAFEIWHSGSKIAAYYGQGDASFQHSAKLIAGPTGAPRMPWRSLALDRSKQTYIHPRAAVF